MDGSFLGNKSKHQNKIIGNHIRPAVLMSGYLECANQVVKCVTWPPDSRWCLPFGSWSVLQCKAIGAPSYCADDKILNDPRQGVASSFAISLTCADSNHYLIAT